MKLCSRCHVAPRLTTGHQTWCRACKTDWQRAYRAGVRLQERVPAPVRTERGCLLWQGAIDVNGYGRITRDGQSRYVHREAYGEENIPEGMTIDHTCEVKHCVERSHLEPVTRGDNVRRYYARRAA